MTRKIIQIATGIMAIPDEEYNRMTKDSKIEIEHNLYALCDDGSVWSYYDRFWDRVPDIPQDEPEQPATSPDVVAALRELAKAEAECREACERFGFHDLETMRLWGIMLQAGDAARDVLKRIDEQEEPR